MKKLNILLSLILICSMSYGQAIIQRSGVGNTVQDARLSAQYNLFVPRYADTTAALAGNAEGIDSCGAIIFTYDYMALWFRSCSNGKRWVMLDPSGVPSSGNSWIIGGNNGLFTSPVSPQYIGTKTNQGTGILTNNIARLTITEAGAWGLGAGLDYGTSGYVLTSNGTGAAPTWQAGGGGSSGWSLTGNSGTTAGTNFIGTTDNVGLMFKVSNQQAGYIDFGGGNTSFGIGALELNSGGGENTAIGTVAMGNLTSGGGNVSIGNTSAFAITTGSSNVAIGNSSLMSVTSANNNTAVGTNSLRSITGAGNIGLGVSSGSYLTSEANRLVISSIDRSDIAGDTTKSIIYGAQDATAANQRLYLNSQTYLPYIAAQANAADSMVVVLPSTGKLGYRAIPSGGGSGTVNSGTQYRLGYYATTGTAISEAAAITANRALISDANGVPTHSATTATQLGYLSSATGTTGTASTNVVFSGTPTLETPVFTTSARTPLLIGGTGTTSTLTLKTTTGAGTTNADMIFQVGNNGATEAMRILNSGLVGINVPAPDAQLSILSSTFPLRVATTFAESAGASLGLYSTSDGNLMQYATGSNTMYLSGFASKGISIAGGGFSERNAGITVLPSNNVGVGASSPTTKLQVAGRFASNQGADVASAAGAIALGSDGNSFEITGTSAITLISNSGWVNGSEVTLLFTSTATLTDGTANSGTDIGMELAGNTNFVASAGATLKLILAEIGGTQRWREVSRSVN